MLSLLILLLLFSSFFFQSKFTAFLFSIKKIACMLLYLKPEWFFSSVFFFFSYFANVAPYLLVFQCYFFPMIEEYWKIARLWKIVTVEITKEKMKTNLTTEKRKKSKPNQWKISQYFIFSHNSAILIILVKFLGDAPIKLQFLFLTHKLLQCYLFVFPTQVTWCF